jgi:hypothetical protein
MFVPLCCVDRDVVRVVPHDCFPLGLLHMRISLVIMTIAGLGDRLDV